MTQPNDNLVLKAALEYQRYGWCVIPIPYGEKKALIKWKQYQTRRPTDHMLHSWFETDKLNMAVILGKVSDGLTCLDFDNISKYEQWKIDHPELAATLPTAQTARGRHVYFRSTLTKSKKMDGLDIKASGYCMLPPSLHPDRKTVYCWLIKPNSELPELTLKDLGIESFTEETEEIEETEDIDDNEEIEAINLTLIVFEALAQKVRDYVDMAIESTLPTKEGYRNFLIFQFCRWLKGHPDFEKCKAGQLKSLVKMWYDRALPKIGTKTFDDTWADFCYGWMRVKYPKGDGTLKIAVENAMNAQDHFAAEGLYETPEIKLLVRICFELQKLQKEEPFWLSEKDGALILGSTKPTLGKWFSMLEADNVIKKVQEHTEKLATRYRFIAN